MEKIEFFRPRYIEQDGSMSVGFWTCENKKVDDGYFYRAADVDALLADVRRLVEAVGKYASLAGGVHEAGCPEDDTCSCHVMVQFEKAIAAVERHLATSSPPHSSPPPADTGRA